MDSSTAWKYRDQFVDLNKKLNGSDPSSADNPSALAGSLKSLDHLIASSAPEDVRKKLTELQSNANTTSPDVLQSQLSDLADSTNDVKVKAQLTDLAANIKTQSDKAAALKSLDDKIQENYPEQLQRELRGANFSSYTTASEAVAIAGGLLAAGLTRWTLAGKFERLANIGLTADRLAPIRTLGLGEGKLVGGVGSRVAEAATGLSGAYVADLGFRRGALGEDSKDWSNQDIFTESSLSVGAAGLSLLASRNVYEYFKGAKLPMGAMAPLATEKIAGILGGAKGEFGLSGINAESVTAKQALDVVEGNQSLKADAELLQSNAKYAKMPLIEIQSDLEAIRARRLATMQASGKTWPTVPATML